MSLAVEADLEEKQRCGLEMRLESSTAGLWVANCRGRVAGMVMIQLVVSTAE